MNLSLFFKGVRSLVSVIGAATAIVGAAPASAMDVGLGDFVRFNESNTMYRVVGAKLIDLKHISLDLEDTTSGATETVTVDRSRTLEDVPGLIVLPQPSRGLPPFM